MVILQWALKVFNMQCVHFARMVCHCFAPAVIARVKLRDIIAFC